MLSRNGIVQIKIRQNAIVSEKLKLTVKAVHVELIDKRITNEHWRILINRDWSSTENEILYNCSNSMDGPNN